MSSAHQLLKLAPRIVPAQRGRMARRSNKGCWPKPLLAMIGASHSSEAMAKFRDYVPDNRAWNILREISRNMLTAVRPEGSGCVIMTALLAMALEEPLGIVIPVVAGALKLDR